jgi:energy-coupling factor transporter transmembrane protein EcfT
MSREVRAAHSHLGPLLIGAMAGSLIAGRIETALLCFAVALGAAVAAGARLPAPRWFAMLAIGVALAIGFNLYLTPGTPLAGAPAIAGRIPTREGLALGVLLIVRMGGAIAALQGLRAAWPGEIAADRIARRLAPLERLRVPVSEARAMIGLSLRFLPLVRSEAARIARVQDLRAGRPPRGAREWWQRRRAAAVPVLVGALERAERVALALDARHHRLRPADDAASGRSAPGWTAAGVALVAVAALWRT